MSVKHRRFLKKVLYKYKIISIKVCLFVGKKQKRHTSSLSGVIPLPLSSLIGICRHYLHLFHGAKGEENGNPLQYSCQENPVDGGAWWAVVHRVAQSWTQLKWLSMHGYIGEENGNPLQYSCLENPRDGGAWWAAVWGSHRVGHDWSDLAAAAAAWSKVAPPSEGWIVSFLTAISCLFACFFFFFFFFFFFLAKAHGTWDLSFLTRDWTYVPSIGSTREIWLNVSWD